MVLWEQMTMEKCISVNRRRVILHCVLITHLPSYFILTILNIAH